MPALPRHPFAPLDTVRLTQTLKRCRCPCELTAHRGLHASHYTHTPAIATAQLGAFRAWPAALPEVTFIPKLDRFSTKRYSLSHCACHHDVSLDCLTAILQWLVMHAKIPSSSNVNFSLWTPAAAPPCITVPQGKHSGHCVEMV